MKAGIFKGKVIKDSAVYAESGANKTLTLTLRVQTEELGALTTYLYFSAPAAPYSLERLRACGWKGQDITDLTGVDANEIQVEVTKDTKPGGGEKWVVSIMTGSGGGVKAENVIDKAAFKAKLAAILGNQTPSAAPAGKADDLPF